MLEIEPRALIMPLQFQPVFLVSVVVFVLFCFQFGVFCLFVCFVVIVLSRVSLGPAWSPPLASGMLGS